MFSTWCGSELTVQLMVQSQTTPTHNMLLYLIWLFNYKPLVDCRSSGSWLEHSFMSSQGKLRQKASSRGLPCRAACGAWDPPGPSSRRFPTLTDASVLMPPAVMVRQSLVSGSAIPCINFSLSLPSRCPASCASCLRWERFESRSTQCGRGGLDPDSATSVPSSSVQGSGCVSAGTWLCCKTQHSSCHLLLTPNDTETDSGLKASQGCVSVSDQIIQPWDGWF